MCRHIHCVARARTLVWACICSFRFPPPSLFLSPHLWTLPFWLLAVVFLHVPCLLRNIHVATCTRRCTYYIRCTSWADTEQGNPQKKWIETKTGFGQTNRFEYNCSPVRSFVCTHTHTHHLRFFVPTDRMYIVFVWMCDLDIVSKSSGIFHSFRFGLLLQSHARLINLRGDPM